MSEANPAPFYRRPGFLILIAVLIFFGVDFVRSHVPNDPRISEPAEVDFEKALAAATTPVLVDFHATWCGPCRRMKPALNKLAKTFDGKLRVMKVDVDQARTLADQMNVRALPTLILFHQGKEVARQQGALSYGRLEAWIAQGLKTRE